MTNKTLEALNDAVIVIPYSPEEATQGNIIIPDMGKDRNIIAKVVTVGPGRYTITGQLIPSYLKPDDVVILPAMGFTKFEFEYEEYFIGPENQILGKINEAK
jgi:co-chaperonin GroES (HSP10)